MIPPVDRKKPDRKIDRQASFLGIPLAWWSCADSDRKVVIVRLGTGIILTVVGFLLFAAGVPRGLAGLFHMLAGMIILVGAAACFGAVISRKCAVTFSNLFFSDRHSSRPQPLYSVHESERVKGKTEDAIAGFTRIAEEYPDEVTPWMHLIDIAFKDLGDPERAREFFHKALSLLEDEEARRQLSRLYRSHLDSSRKER